MKEGFPGFDLLGKLTFGFADEPGLLIGQINENLKMVFDGYKGNEKQTESKILRNVFKKGDAFWNSGDLLYQDKDYFLYFSDRIGDTFRSVTMMCNGRGILGVFRT